MIQCWFQRKIKIDARKMLWLGFLTFEQDVNIVRPLVFVPPRLLVCSSSYLLVFSSLRRLISLPPRPLVCSPPHALSSASLSSRRIVPFLPSRFK